LNPGPHLGKVVL